MIAIPLFKNHRILTQTAGRGMNVLKLPPPLVIGERDREWLVSALDAVIADCHKVPGSAWELGKTLAGHALKARAG